MTRTNIELSFKQKDLLYRLALQSALVYGYDVQAQPSTIISLFRRGLIDSPDYVRGVFPTTSRWSITARGLDLVQVYKKLDTIAARKRTNVRT